MTKLPLHWQILIAIGAAIIVGILFDTNTTVLGVSLYETFTFIGKLFLNALKMIIVPLIFSSIICGVASMGSGEGIGRLGGKTLGFYMLSSTLAILVGLFFVNLISPGIIDGAPAGERLNLSSSQEVGTKLEKIGEPSMGDMTGIFLRMVPTNIVAAAAEGQMLGLICFALLFGYFMMRTIKAQRETLLNFWQGIFETMMSITLFVMKFAPIGVFALVGTTMLNTGWDSFLPLSIFFITVVLALLTHALITLSILLKTLGGVNPLRQLQAMKTALLTAFSTASSSGTLPVTMECMEKNAKVSEKTTSFVLPLGATVNMDGTALYECVAAMFIAQAYGLDLSFTVQLTIVITALLTSVGVAGVPSASLVAITIILGSVGLPAEGIGMLLVTDRILDMVRTAVNVYGDSCCATVIARTEGEKQVLAEPVKSVV